MVCYGQSRSGQGNSPKSVETGKEKLEELQDLSITFKDD